MKKLILLLLLAFHAVSMVSIANSPAPWPECLPCPDDDGNRGGSGGGGGGWVSPLALF